MELEALDAELLNLALGHPDRLGAAVRVDRAERDEHVGVVVPGPLGDLLGGGAGRVLRLVLDVDGERHRRHLPLAVVRGQVIDGERGRRGLEVGGHRGQLLVLFRLDRRGADRAMHMRVHVDRDQTVDIHGRDYPGGISARHEVITPISGTINLWASEATGRSTRDSCARSGPPAVSRLTPARGRGPFPPPRNCCAKGLSSGRGSRSWSARTGRVSPPWSSCWPRRTGSTRRAGRSWRRPARPGLGRPSRARATGCSSSGAGRARGVGVLPAGRHHALAVHVP